MTYRTSSEAPYDRACGAGEFIEATSADGTPVPPNGRNNQLLEHAEYRLLDG